MRRDIDLKKVTTPVLVHLLRDDFRIPGLFLLRCRLTLGGFKRNIDSRFPDELVELAALPLWVYINLKKKVGQRRAFEIMRIALLTGGIAQWNVAYRTVEEPRTFDNLCHAEIDVNKTGPTRWNTLVVVNRGPKRFEVKITRCLYHELAISVGVPELTPLVCQIDNAGFNSYLPDSVVFTRGGPGNRITDGAKECNFIWELVE
jgi:hypothetical protein